MIKKSKINPKKHQVSFRLDLEWSQIVVRLRRLRLVYCAQIPPKNKVALSPFLHTKNLELHLYLSFNLYYGHPIIPSIYQDFDKLH